jgi:hypothetical protein
MADATVSNTVEGNLVRVQIPASAPSLAALPQLRGPDTLCREVAAMSVPLGPVGLIVVLVVVLLIVGAIVSRPK